MSNYMEPAIIESGTTFLKPILLTTYDVVTKYNLHIVYEDSTTKDVELVQKDKNRPYKFTFKKEGKLITATGVPTIKEISECSKFCDFTNRVLDSNDLLIELDCSGTYDCNKVRFYLKDVRDIIDLAIEGDISEEDKILNHYHQLYPIYLNGFSCKEKIRCKVDDESRVLLKSLITKVGSKLSSTEYKDFYIIKDSEIIMSDVTVEEDGENVYLTIPEELIGTEIKLIISYYINEIEHPVFDQFIIIPYIEEQEEIIDTGSKLRRAVSTQDMQYLGDGLKPALGIGLTPAYKQYRNRKSYNDSVMED